MSGNNTYGGGTLNAATLVVANTAGWRGTGPVGLSAARLPPARPGARSAAWCKPITPRHTIAPGADLASGYGTLNLLGGLNTNSHTTLEFNMNLSSPIGGSTYGGDLINLGTSALNVTGGSITFVGTDPTAAGDYRLFADIGGSITNLNGLNLILSPESGYSYSLTTAADPGYIDLAITATTAVTSGGTWGGGSGTSWATSGNWASQTVPSNGTVTFPSTAGSPISVTLDGPQSAGALVFSATNANGGFVLTQGEPAAP